MSRENVEIVRRSYEAYRQGDYTEALKCFAPDVVYEVAQEAPVRGPEGVRAVWERWQSAWDDTDTVAEEFIDAGDHVVIAVRYSARGRTSGIEIDDRLFDVYKMRAGECVHKAEYRERAEALEAAGLTEYT